MRTAFEVQSWKNHANCMVEISWNIGTEIWVTRMILMNNIYPTSQNSWSKAKTIMRSRIGPNSIMHRLLDKTETSLMSSLNLSSLDHFFYCKIFVFFSSNSYLAWTLYRYERPGRTRWRRVPRAVHEVVEPCRFGRMVEVDGSCWSSTGRYPHWWHLEKSSFSIGIL